jgi:hypothetical protein
MCWKRTLPNCLCQGINHSQLGIIQLSSAFPCAGLQEDVHPVKACSPCTDAPQVLESLLLLVLLRTTL